MLRDIQNSEIVRIFYEIAEYLMMDAEPFRPRAYAKVAEAIEALGKEIKDVYAEGGLKALEEIPGVGKGIAEKIEELLTTGKIEYYEELKRATPIKLYELTRVEGLGPKKAKKLYEALGIKDLSDLERAAKEQKIRSVEGFGEKSEYRILRGIEFLKSFGGRFLLGSVLRDVRRIVESLQRIKGVRSAEVAGSIRRRRETVGDADILAVAKDAAPIMDFFVKMPGVIEVIAKGDTKSSVKLQTGLNVDLRVVGEESAGAALAYFTGSKEHNVALRAIAIEKGLKLNEYGLFKAKRDGSEGERVAGKTEEEIYKTLGFPYIEPELREMRGEIEAAKKGELPKIIGYDKLRGDLQVQTSWTDGANSIQEMANAALARGLEYIAITDHTKRLAMTSGLDEQRLLLQGKEIDEVNKKLEKSGKKFRILKGTECDILENGSLDLADEALRRLDVVGISVHSLFKLPKERQTARIQKAMRNPCAHILFHPTGRLILRRDPYEIDIEAIIQTAKEEGMILEANAFPDRLDLKDEYLRMAKEAGVKISIDSDSHATEHFALLEYGIGQARRGWIEEKEVINTLPVEKMLQMLKKKK